MKNILTTVSCLVLIPSATLFAQDYQITSFTIDGGGASNSVSGSYTLSGTIGQPDAGEPMLVGSYELRSGFWPAISGPAACPADFAAPFGELNFFDVSAFLTGFNAMDPISDMNNDGLFNFFDVSEFLSFYSQGCP